MPDRAVDGRLSVDELFDLLRHPRRRDALRHLVGTEGSVTVEDLARALAEERAESHRLVAAALRHKHLPKLTENGVVRVGESVEVVGMDSQMEAYLDLAAEQAGLLAETDKALPTGEL